MAIPTMVSAMPATASRGRVSPRNTQPRSAASSGTSDIIRVQMRGPRISSDLIRQKSPKTKPARPDADSRIQVCDEEAAGQGLPLAHQTAGIRKTSARTRRIRLSDSEPMRRPAFSKISAVNAQQPAAPRAAIWPVYLPSIGEA
jgi:hypothetical protein